VTVFRAEIFQNEYLSVGSTTVDAIVRVTSSGAGNLPDRNPSSSEIIIVDCSGSMEHPTKLRKAKDATAAAVDCLRDGVRFAVLAGNTRATQVYPKKGLAVADERTRASARGAVASLRAGGGTAIGSWLARAEELFAAEDTSIRHAILLTDGRNEDETAEALDAVLALCEGRFQCDCRGVGDDWEVSELRRIASTLLGTVDIVRRPEELPAEFSALMEAAMGKAVSGLGLQIWTPRGASVALLKQTAPDLEDLTGRRRDVSELVGEYPTGAWGDESRDYHLRVSVPAKAVGDRMLAGRVSLALGGDVVAEGKVLAVWTDDRAMSTRLNDEVAHATGVSELADAIREGIDAWEHDDAHAATRHLGLAVQLADRIGDGDLLGELERIVDVEDASTGTVRLRADARKIDVMTLDTGSTKTIRRTGEGVGDPP
jgi:hypothetical protein